MSKTTIIIVLTAILSAATYADTIGPNLPTAEVLLGEMKYDNCFNRDPVTSDQLIPNTPDTQDLIYPIDPTTPRKCFELLPNVDVTPADFINLTLEDAKNLAAAHGKKYRVLRVDGEHYPATADYLPERLNFQVEEGIVTQCTKG